MAAGSVDDVENIVQHRRWTLGDECPNRTGVPGDKVQAADRRRRCQPGSQSTPLALEGQLTAVLQLRAAALPLGYQILDICQPGGFVVPVFAARISPRAVMGRHGGKVGTEQDLRAVLVLGRHPLAEWRCGKPSAA